MVIFSLTYILQEKVSKSCDLSLASTGLLNMVSDCALISASMSCFPSCTDYSELGKNIIFLGHPVQIVTLNRRLVDEKCFDFLVVVHPVKLLDIHVLKGATVLKIYIVYI